MNPWKLGGLMGLAITVEIREVIHLNIGTRSIGLIQPGGIPRTLIPTRLHLEDHLIVTGGGTGTEKHPGKEKGINKVGSMFLLMLPTTCKRE